MQFALIRRVDAGQDFHERRFAGAVLTDQGHHLAGADGKRHAVQGLNAGKTLANRTGGEKDLCFVGLWAYNPPAILSAVKDKDLLGKVKIVGFDENDATLQGIADGHIYGTIVQNPFEFGYQSVRLMASLAKGDKSVLPKDGILYVPHRVISKEGGNDRVAVEKFRKELNELLGK